MAQAQITLQTRAPSGLWLRIAASWADLKARHEAKLTLAKMLAERELGLATGSKL
ncbi:MAG: hypothetical protein ACRDH9_02110 [Actinomycetota bacterium]